MACFGSEPTTTTLEPTTTTLEPATTVVQAATETDFKLRVAILAQPQTDNPWATFDVGNDYWSVYVNPAPAQLYTSEGPLLSLIPQVADDVAPPEAELGESGYTVTVRLRDYATWSDGVPVTSEDVAFTFETVKRFGYMGRDMSALWPLPPGDDADSLTEGPGVGVTAVEAVDPKTVKISFSEIPGLEVWPYGVGMAPIFPAHYWRPIVEASTDLSDLYEVSGLGSPSIGPYESVVPAGDWDWTNSAVKDYWNEGARYTVFGNGSVRYELASAGVEEVYGPEPIGAVIAEYVDDPQATEISYRVYGQPSEAVQALASNEVDVFLSPLGIPQVMAGDLRSLGLDVVTNERRTIHFLAFNLRHGPMDQKPFRQALACRVDRDLIAMQTLDGQVAPASEMVPAQPPWTNTPDSGDLCEDLNVPTGGTEPRSRFDHAVNLLREAGFTWDREPVWDLASLQPEPGMGLSDPGGSPIEPLEILVPANEPGLLREKYADEIAILGNELGIPIVVTPMAFEDLVSVVFSGAEVDAWDMYLLAWGPLPILPSYLFDFFRSDSDIVLSGVNSTGFSNEEFDELARQFDQARNQAEAIELISSAEAILADEVPSVFLFHPLIVEAFSDDLEMPFRQSPDGLQSWFQGVGLVSAIGRPPAS